MSRPKDRPGTDALVQCKCKGRKVGLNEATCRGCNGPNELARDCKAFTRTSDVAIYSVGSTTKLRKSNHESERKSDRERTGEKNGKNLRIDC